MAEFIQIGLSITGKVIGQSFTTYDRDDIVRVGGKSYVCLETHTADAVFRTDLYYIKSGSSLAKPKMESND